MSPRIDCFKKASLMNENESMQEDVISLFNLWLTLRKGWRWVVGGALLGTLGAITLLAMTPPVYMASALLQSGKVAGTVVEEPATVVERLRSPAFLLELARDVGETTWVEQIEAGSGLQVLLAQLQKASPTMVSVTVRAGSPDQAQRIVADAMSKLINRQDELSKQILGKIRFDLSVAKEKLNKAENDLAMLSKTLNGAAVRDERFTQLSLLTSIKLQKESDIFALRQTVFALEASILPPATQPARILEAIFVSSLPVSPKKRLFLALGLVGGLLAGVASVFISNAWKELQERRLAELAKI